MPEAPRANPPSVSREAGVPVRVQHDAARPARAGEEGAQAQGAGAEHDHDLGPSAAERAAASAFRAAAAFAAARVASACRAGWIRRPRPQARDARPMSCCSFDHVATILRRDEHPPRARPADEITAIANMSRYLIESGLPWSWNEAAHRLLPEEPRLRRPCRARSSAARGIRDHGVLRRARAFELARGAARQSTARHRPPTGRMARSLRTHRWHVLVQLEVRASNDGARRSTSGLATAKPDAGWRTTAGARMRCG